MGFSGLAGLGFVGFGEGVEGGWGVGVLGGEAVGELAVGVAFAGPGGGVGFGEGPPGGFGLEGEGAGDGAGVGVGGGVVVGEVEDVVPEVVEVAAGGVELEAVAAAVAFCGWGVVRQGGFYLDGVEGLVDVAY